MSHWNCLGSSGRLHWIWTASCLASKWVVSCINELSNGLASYLACERTMFCVDESRHTYEHPGTARSVWAQKCEHVCVCIETATEKERQRESRTQKYKYTHSQTHKHVHTRTHTHTDTHAQNHDYAISCVSGLICSFVSTNDTCKSCRDTVAIKSRLVYIGNVYTHIHIDTYIYIHIYI